jgi:hypothetical protein
MMPASISVAGRRCDRDKCDNPSHPQPATMDQHLNHAPLKSVDRPISAADDWGAKNCRHVAKDSLRIWQIKEDA